MFFDDFEPFKIMPLGREIRSLVKMREVCLCG
jgi:hypothetical protein